MKKVILNFYKLLNQKLEAKINVIEEEDKPIHEFDCVYLGENIPQTVIDYLKERNAL